VEETLLPCRVDFFKVGLHSIPWQCMATVHALNVVYCPVELQNTLMPSFLVQAVYILSD
jgi:hypothetical protein